ncbi:MAG: hypothetical protein KKH93_03385, partial [Candidatus Omnitrophica bacterium]|nr:hypothetical protein [Candidatus Omnitrophota bacterium]MBU2043723.1 hypothetical protein [Candidatus Omnitrophota bacterium]
MKSLKFLLIFVAVIILCQLLVFAEEQPRWQDICKGSKNPYCVSVDKAAYNNDSHPIPLRGIFLGKISGVVWKEKGEVVSNAGEAQKLAPQNAYYYIIDNQISQPFLKLSSEVEVREEEPYKGFIQP